MPSAMHTGHRVGRFPILVQLDRHPSDNRGSPRIPMPDQTPPERGVLSTATKLGKGQTIRIPVPCDAGERLCEHPLC